MGKRVLTVDDSKTMRDMLKLALTEAGYDVVQADDGAHGVEVLQSTPDIDVIVTDINMPRMDGYAFIDSVRKNPKNRTTPILVLTTESEPEKKRRAREAGATGWIVKPFDPVKLVAAINRVAP
jgi:two-component system chemotaxis response regulator CheY